MGTQKVNRLEDVSDRHKFIKSLLTDVRSLEYLLDNNWIESGITRFGAEVEMVVVDRDTLKPKNIAMSVMDQMKHPKWLDGELAQFNLEFNLMPREFKGNNFSLMEKEIHSYLKKLETTLKKNNATCLLYTSPSPRD